MELQTLSNKIYLFLAAKLEKLLYDYGKTSLKGGKTVVKKVNKGEKKKFQTTSF